MRITSWAPLIFLLLWSGGFTVAKIGIVDADPITLLALRYLCVVILLLPIYFYIKPELPASKNEWAHAAIVGFLIQVLYFGTAYKAFSAGASAGAVALITCLQPIFVAMVMPLISQEQVTTRSWLGLFLGLSGAVIVIAANQTIQIHTAIGVWFSIAALFGITLATIWEKKFSTAQHPLTNSLIQYSIGFIFTVLIAWHTEPMNITWTTPFALSLAYLVIGNSILAISLLMIMIQRGEATRVAALFFLVPPVTAFIAWLVIDEAMAPMAWAGMLVAAVGVWLTSKTPKPSY